MRKRKIKTLFMSVLTVFCSVFVMSIAQESKVLAAENENVFEMTQGGSIRIAEPYGLRFQVKMSADVKNKADKVGMLIFPADYLVDNGTDGDVYYDSVEALANTTNPKHRIKLDLTQKLYEKDGYWYGNGVIVNIKGKNMSRDFVGIAYYETYDEIVWADTSKIANTTRSAAQVALLAHADKTSTYAAETDQLLLNYIGYTKDSDLKDVQIGSVPLFVDNGDNVAKSYWNAEYVDGGVKIKIDVNDRISIDANDLGYSDNVEIQMQAVDNPWKTKGATLNILCDGSGRTWLRCWNGYGYDAIELAAEDYSCNFNTTETGYQVELFVSYRALNVTEAEGKGNVRICPMLRNRSDAGNNAQATSDLFGCNWYSTKSWFVLNGNNRFGHSFEEQFTLASKNAEATNILANLATLKAENGGKMMKTEVGNQAHPNSTWCIDGIASDLVNTNYVFAGLEASATVAKAGYVVTCISDDNTALVEKFVNEGWTLLAGKCRSVIGVNASIDGALSSTTSYYVKYCEAGEYISTYGVYSLMFGKATIKSSDLAYETTPAYHSFAAVNKDYYMEDNNTMNGMPSVAVTNGGRIYAVYMTGTDGEYQMKNSGIVKYSDDDGKTWNRLFVIDTWDNQKINGTKQIVCSDYELKVDPETNVLYVSYTVRPNANGVLPMDTQTWMFTISNPDAEVVSEETLEVSEHWNTGLGYVRNGFTILKNGDFIIVPNETRQSAQNTVYISTGENKGRTWNAVGSIYAPQATWHDEPVVVEKQDGSLWCLMTSNTGYLIESLSYDGGKTWTVGRQTKIENPSSRFAITRLASGKLIMVSNSSTSNTIGMVVAVSSDDGDTWEEKLCLFDGYASYPTIALDNSTETEQIHVVFDDGRYYHGQWRTGVEEGTKYEYYAEIYHDVLTEDEIMAGGDPNKDELELLFVGDSYTDRPWCLGFDNALGIYGADTIGIGGTEVYQWNNETKLAEVVAKNPKNLFINIGINNIGNKGEDGTTVGNQVVAYLEALKEALPNTEIYYNMIVYPTTGWHDYNAITGSNAIVEAYIDSDTTDKVHKIDIRDEIKRCGEADNAKFTDTLHMSAPGYTILFDAIKKEIGFGRRAKDLNIVSCIGKEVSKYEWADWEDNMINSDAPTRYKVRGYAADDGIYFNAVQYVDNLVTTGDGWTEQTHLEMEMWQWNGVGSNSGFVYGSFWIDGNWYLVNSDGVLPYGVTFVKNNVTITDRGANYEGDYRYKVSYEVYIQFNNNLENPNDGPYAYVHFRHHMPGESTDGFEQSVQEHRDGNRYLWRDAYSSYEFRKVGIIRRDGLGDFKTNLDQLNALQNTWVHTEKGFYSYSVGDTFALSQTIATNFIYEADVLFAENKGAASLVFRSADDPTTGSYVANIDKTNQSFRVFKFPGGGNVCTAPLKENKDEYHLRIEAIGDLIKFYVDGELVTTGNDVTFTTGKLGLLTWYSTVFYQNVKYREITSDDVLSLEALQVTGGEVEMAPAYSKNVASYNVFMPSGTEDINVLATAGEGVELTYVLKSDNGVEYDKGTMESGTSKNITPSYGVSTMVIKMKKGDMASSVSLKITNKSDVSVLAAEDYRPQLHFTPEINFMNDPNGLVYDPSNETWHMFFQYSPQLVTMGSQTWGHAVSDDLINWVELPVALEMDDFGAVFSGSCVVDENNTSGFFTDNKEGESKLVAMYTSWGATATQNIAYSKDHGVTWTKYRPAAGQPVIPDNYHDGIRDPKIFKISGDEKDLWYMVIAGGRGRIFVSEDLKEWTLIQELTYADGSELHSECPDLYPLEVLDKDGNTTGESKWVYSASSEFYIIGDMVKGGDDYYRFQAEERIDSQTGGNSNAYAAQSYYNDPVSGRRISVHWMMDWSAPGTIPTKRWNGAQSFPLETTLKVINDGYTVVQNPVEEVKQLRGDVLYSKKNITVSETSDNILAGITGQVYEIEAVFSNFSEATEFGFELRTGNGQTTVYKYNVEKETVTLDKSLSGVYDNDVLSWVLIPRSDGTVKLRAIVDKSIIETFGNDGEAHLIDMLFADESSVGMSFYTVSGSVTIDEITVYDMKSIYTGKSVTSGETETFVSLDARETVKQGVYFTVTANVFPMNKFETVEWILPSGVEKVSETETSITLKANAGGTYTISAKINGKEVDVEVQATLNEPIELQMTTNYFQNTGGSVYALNSNSDDESKVDYVMYAGHILRTAYYSVKGKVTVDPSEDWAQARIIVSEDAQNEHIFAIERVDGTNYQIFTMSKNNEMWWNDWRLVAHSQLNGANNSIDFEVITIGKKLYFLINDEICYTSNRVAMATSTVKFSSFKNATTTVQGLEGQIFGGQEDANEYLATKNEKAYESVYQVQIDDRYNKYFVESDCTNKGGTLILGHSHMDPVFFANWQTQMGLTDYVDGYNVGIGGTTTKDWLYAYDKLVKPFNADRFIISVGENDIGVWGSDGTEVVARLEQLFKKIHNDHPDAEIYYIYSLPAVVKYSEGKWLNPKYENLVTGEKALCESLDYVEGIDTFSVLVDTNTMNVKAELFGANNDIHLNADGYLLWSDYLYGEIFGGEKSFSTNLTGWTALGGNWTVTRRGLGATNSGYGDCFYMSNTSISANQSWVFEADVVVEQGGAGGIVFGVKDPANPSAYWGCINSDKGQGEFKQFKGGGQQTWYKGISYGALADTNAYHFRVEYDVEKSLITYKIAPYGTEDYVITETQEDTELSAYNGNIYFGLVTCVATVTYNNVNLYTQ